MYNPMLNQQIAQLDQEYAQRKANLMQSFYSQQQGGNWGQQNQAPPQVQSQQQEPEQTKNVNWIIVNGVQGAKALQIPANATYWLMDSGDSAFYVKETDKFGTLKTFKGYRFAEIPEQELNGMLEPQIDMSKYVSKAEFDDLKAQLEQLTTAQKKQPVKANKGVEDNG